MTIVEYKTVTRQGTAGLDQAVNVSIGAGFQPYGNPVSKINRFCCYWRESIAAAKEGHEIVALVLFIVWQVIYWVSKYWGFGTIEGVHSKVLDIAEVASIAFFSAWGLLWLPFKRHEAERAQFEAAQKSHAEEKRALEERIRAMSDTKEKEERAASIRTASKEIMANQLANLEVRITEIRRMSCIAYKNSKKDGRDVVTDELLNKISSFLREHVSPDAAVLFTSRTGIKYTLLSGEGGFGYREAEEQQLVIDHLNHFAAQLKDIIKGY
jgi:hypothetical protein